MLANRVLAWFCFAASVAATVASTLITYAPGATVMPLAMFIVPLGCAVGFFRLARRLGRLPKEHVLLHSSRLNIALLLGAFGFLSLFFG